MRPVTVRILHPEPPADAGPTERWVADARAAVAERHRLGFAAAGAADVGIVRGSPDDTPFGRRLRDLVRAERPEGLVVLGSGAIPLATARDRRDLVEAAGADDRIALTNNRYSADVIAVARPVDGLADLPDLATDNALPRWLETSAGYEVTDLRRRWRLAIDIDGPIDVVLTGGRRSTGGEAGSPVDTAAVIDRIGALRRIAADPHAEILVAGRTSAASLAWLERRTPSRTRAFVEERGLRTSQPGQRPPHSVLGALLERDGLESFGEHVARLADGAVVDTRVLIANRCGADERGWPRAEDRFASDLLAAEGIVDPWLRALTASAAAAPIPILLGGHTLVGPGVRLLFGRTEPWT
jgi:hypothetical protein